MLTQRFFGRAVKGFVRSVESLFAKRWSPEITQSEEPHEVRLSVDLGDMIGDDVAIGIRHGRLVCSGYHSVKRRPGMRSRPQIVRFRRAIRMPDDADLSSIETREHEGRLEVRVARNIAQTPLA